MCWWHLGFYTIHKSSVYCGWRGTANSARWLEVEQMSCGMVINDKVCKSQWRQQILSSGASLVERNAALFVGNTDYGCGISNDDNNHGRRQHWPSKDEQW